MRTSNGLAAAGLALAMLAVGSLAAAQDVTYNAMPGTDFAKYKTYKWVAITDGVHPDQIVDAQIKQALDTQLAAKGFKKTDADTADMYVGYQVSVNQEKQWNAYGGGIGFRGMGTATSSTLSIGTLGFDVYDAKAKQLIWRGAATKTLDAKPSPDKRQKNLDKAVEKLLKDFPPTK